MKISKITQNERIICYILFIAPAILGFIHIPAQYALISTSFLIVFTGYFTDKKFQRICFSFPLLIWLTLTLFHVFNAYAKDVPGVDAIDLLHGLKIYSCIAIVTYWASIDFQKTVKFLTEAFVFRCLIVLFLLLLFPHAHEDSERLTGAGGSATGLGQMAAITGIFITYLNTTSKITLIKNLWLYLTPLVVVFLTQSRNSLGMIFISLFISVFVAYKSINKFISLRLIAALAVFTIGATIAFTSFSETDFAQRFDTTEQEESYFYKHNATETFFDTIVGDRLPYYVLGWDFFRKSPITGIGMWNYKYLTGGTYPLHSEYMVHLCEGGIIAAVLWVTFILCVLRVIIKHAPNTNIKIAAISSIFVLLFCGIYAREFFYEIFYPAYGLALSFYFRKKWHYKFLKKYIRK